MASTTAVTARWKRIPFIAWLLGRLGSVPLAAFLLGGLISVGLERLIGLFVARLLGLSELPLLLGTVDVLEPFSDIDLAGILGPLFPTSPQVAPFGQSGQALGSLFVTLAGDIPPFLLVLVQVVAYDFLILVLPTIIVAALSGDIIQQALQRLPSWLNTVMHVAILYAIVWVWGGENAYRELILMFIGINVILSVSLNLINGYMGEFSVGHAAFMAIGAYVSSILTMWLFIDEAVFGPPVLPVVTTLPLGIGIGIGFVIALIAGGVAAAIGGLFVAFPSFKTRGDYLAIVTLAVNFIVQAAINNMEFIGGPRGLKGVPLWSTMTWVFAISLLSVVAVRNLVNSTFGKGIVAIREDEIAANLMSVDTRRVKLVAFLLSSFLAGVAGGLFAHVLAYVNPGVFGIVKSTEVLVMVYLGGMGSITGSIVSAVIFTVFLEALRPLGVLKWVFIPLILILLMIYRPQGLFGNREISLNLGRMKSKASASMEVRDDTSAD